MVWQEFCSYTKKKEDFNEDEILEFLKHSMGYGRAPSGADMIVPLSPGHIVQNLYFTQIFLEIEWEIFSELE